MVIIFLSLNTGLSLPIFSPHHSLLLPPSQGQKRWVGWKASQGQSSMRQHDGKAASAEEKGREGGSNLRHISSIDTSSKLSQYRAIICSNTGTQASCRKLLQAARVGVMVGFALTTYLLPRTRTAKAVSLVSQKYSTINGCQNIGRENEQFRLVTKFTT